jgi:hypothetical protein
MRLFQERSSMNLNHPKNKRMNEGMKKNEKEREKYD